MGRPTALIEDVTALDGDRIDVAARIGWLLRISRMGRGLSLSRLSEAVSGVARPFSVPLLSTAERSGLRDGNLIDAYETALELEPGQLRAPIDILCRTFPYAPSDRSPVLRAPVPLAVVDGAFEPVLRASPRGGEWLRWARVVRAGGGAGLPTVLVAPLLERLLSELARSVGPGFTTRYEAVAQLRCSVYADATEDAVRRHVHEAPTNLSRTAMSAVSEEPTVRLLAWAASLLRRPEDGLVGGASVAIENMAELGGLGMGDWAPLVEPFVVGQAAAADTGEAVHYSRLLKTLPPSVAELVAARLARPPVTLDLPRSWEPGVANRQHALAVRVAAGLCERLEVGEQPMLARLLWETLYDFRGTRASNAAYLLMASPFAGNLNRALIALIESPPDSATHAGALRALVMTQTAQSSSDVQAWVERSSPWHEPRALMAAGNAGVHVPDGHARVREAGEEVLGVVEVLGMSRHPDLAAVAADETLPGAVRRAASWWCTAGGRVTA